MRQRSYFGQFVLAVLIVAFSFGCEQMARKPATLEEGIFAAASYGTTLVHSVNNARQTRAITVEQHEGALMVLQEVKDGLQTALDAYRAGNYAAAQNSLDVAEASLRSISILVQRFGEPE